MIQTYDGLDALPKSLRLYGASDFATMEARAGKKEPDFTEHGVWGIDRVGDLWAIDWWSKQCETDVGIAAVSYTHLLMRVCVCACACAHARAIGD